MTNLTKTQGQAFTTDSATELDVSLLQPGEEGDWDNFVNSSPTGTFFHLSGWTRIVERTLGHRCISLIARRGRNIVGVFPIARIRNKLFGDCLVSQPLAVYAGISANEQEAYIRLLKAGIDLATQYGVNYLEMRNRSEPFPTSLPGRDLYVTFTQDLSPGPEKLMQGLPRDTRYIIRKSMKAGLTWTEDLSLNEFYDLYASSVHRLGTPVFPKSLLSGLRNEFPRQCRIFGVRKNSKAIAGVLCFYFHDQVMPYYAGSLPEFNRDSPNNFMYWNLMCQSHMEGFGHFDFGRSKRGTGAYHFKSTWGMKMTELPYKYYLVKSSEVPHLSPVDTIFQLPIAAWKRMPLVWTKIVGPKVIRWIPSV